MKTLNKIERSSEVEKYLEEILKKLEENTLKYRNDGHDALINDLIGLIGEALDYHFDDIVGNYYAAPKITLRKIFLDLAQNVVDGKYDNLTK